MPIPLAFEPGQGASSDRPSIDCRGDSPSDDRRAPAGGSEGLRADDLRAGDELSERSPPEGHRDDLVARDDGEGGELSANGDFVGALEPASREADRQRREQDGIDDEAEEPPARRGDRRATMVRRIGALAHIHGHIVGVGRRRRVDHVDETVHLLFADRWDSEGRAVPCVRDLTSVQQQAERAALAVIPVAEVVLDDLVIGLGLYWRRRLGVHQRDAAVSAFGELRAILRPTLAAPAPAEVQRHTRKGGRSRGTKRSTPDVRNCRTRAAVSSRAQHYRAAADTRRRKTYGHTSAGTKVAPRRGRAANIHKVVHSICWFIHLRIERTCVWL